MAGARRSAQREELERARNQRTNRMLISMVVVFGICWYIQLPTFTLRKSISINLTTGLKIVFSQMDSYFQILLRGYLGLGENVGGGSSIFVFYCIFMIQFFQSLLRGYMRCPPPPSPPPCLHLCSENCIQLLYIFSWRNCHL